MNYRIVTLVFVTLILVFTSKGITGPVDINSLKMNELKYTPFETSTERGRYSQMVSIAERGDFNVDEFKDFSRPDLGWYNGHYYPAFPPGISAMGVPFYLVGKLVGMPQPGAYSISILATLVTCWLIFMICKELGLSKPAAILSVMVFIFASPAWTYGSTLSAHAFSAGVISLTFWAYIKFIRTSNKNYARLMWFGLGINFFIDYPNFFILVPIFVAATLRSIKYEESNANLRLRFNLDFVKQIFPLAILFGLFVTYNLIHYRKPIAFTNTYNLQRLRIQGIEFDENNLSNELFSQKAYSGRFSISDLQDGMKILLLSEDRGLVVFAPLLVIGLFGGLLLIRSKAIGWPLVFTFLCNLILYSAFDDPWGGWSFGPRYLIPSMPLLAVGVGHVYDHLRFNKFAVSVIAILVIYGVGVNLLGALSSNLIPPSVEAWTMGVNWRFTSNLSEFLAGNSSSMIYNIFFASGISTSTYYIGLLAATLTGIVMLMMAFRKDGHGN